MKIRRDFVSNSSSSSYIVSTKLSVDSLTKKLFRYSYGRKRPNPERKKWLDEGAIALSKWLKTHSCLTIFGFDFTHQLTETMKKKFYLGHPCPNSLYCGCCCPDEYLDKYFDKDGNIKSTAKSETIMNALTWYRITDKGKLMFNHEDVGYVSGHSGKITDKSIKFNRWIIESLIKRYPGITIKRKDNILKDLDRLEQNIKNGNWYYLTINHDGDGIDEDAAYYSNYSGDEKDRDPFVAGETYFDILVNEGIVEELSWMESM